MSLAQKTKTFSWFALRPRYWRQAVAIAQDRLLNKPSSSKNAAVEWADTHAVNPIEILKRCGAIASLDDPEALFQDDFLSAHALADAAPVKMGGPGYLTFLYSLLSSMKEIYAIETGVAYGWSSLVFLLRIEAHGGHLASVDKPWNNPQWNSSVGCIVPARLRSHWTLIQEADRQGLPKALKKMDGRMNFCHYDSDKSYTGRMWAYPQLWESLIPGGLFVSDDIGDNMAFAHFAQQVNLEPLVVKDNRRFVGILVKP